MRDFRFTTFFRVPALLGAFLAAGIVWSADMNPDATAKSKPELGDWGIELDTRDLGADPGNDFFRYANGAWLDTYEIPQDLAGTGSFTKLFLRSEQQVKAIIEETSSDKADAGSLGRKVGVLYSGYLDTTTIESRGLEPLTPYMNEINVAENPGQIADLMARFDRVDGGGFGGGGAALFSFYIDQDEKDPSKYIPKFSQGGLGLPDRDYYLDGENERFVKAKKAYREYLEKMLALAGKDDPSGRADRLLELEDRIAQVHWPSEDLRDIDKTYNKKTRKEIEALAPGFPWQDYMDALGMGTQDEFIVSPPSAFAGMAKIFSETPTDVWKDYLTYWLLRSNAGMLPKKVDDTHFEFTSKAISGSKEQRERSKRATQFVNGAMGEALGRIYVERHFPPDAKKQMDELVKNLIIAMGDRIDHLEWMSDETKKAAREKLSKFNVKIGYPDKWKDYSGLEIKDGDLVGNAFRARAFTYDFHLGKLGKPVDRKEWFMSPQTVNAYYNGSMNEIVFPAGILQPPFFDPNADPAVNYGGIGAVIGHEIGHGFDDQGRKSDGDGVLRDWWTPEDATRFKERADKLVAQYSKFSPLEGMTINGELTLGENIGDIGGLEIAYHAYKLSLKGKEASVIDGLTGDQRFFLGFAQIWCGKLRDATLVNQLASDPHSPVRFRVNGTLPNIDEWYEAFNVTPNHAMYLPPEERVRIW